MGLLGLDGVGLLHGIGTQCERSIGLHSDAFRNHQVADGHGLRPFDRLRGRGRDRGLDDDRF